MVGKLLASRYPARVPGASTSPAGTRRQHELARPTGPGPARGRPLDGRPASGYLRDGQMAPPNAEAERDELAAARQALEKRLEGRDLELHDKEEELFLQLERVVRLEEDCEKLRAEKDKFAQMKDDLEKERQEAYRRLKQQSRESEATRRGLERARQEVVRQVSVIAAEKDFLERENESLKQQLEEQGRYFPHHHVHLVGAHPGGHPGAHPGAHPGKPAAERSVEQELSELKLMARQSQSLNSQLKKAMKHLATCRRKKCHVCAYTREAFGEYASRNDGKLFSCLQAPLQPLHDWRNKRRGASSTPSPYCSDEGELFDDDADGDAEAEAAALRSEYSFRRACSSTAPSSPSPSPSHSLPLHCLGPHISFIDEASCSSGDSGQGEDRCTEACHCLDGVAADADQSLTSSCSAQGALGEALGPPSAARAFSSDSGFSSELYESALQRSSERSSERSSDRSNSSSRDQSASSASSFQRGTRWTASFRKLLTRVSTRKSTTTSTTTTTTTTMVVTSASSTDN